MLFSLARASAEMERHLLAFPQDGSEADVLPVHGVPAGPRAHQRRRQPRHHRGLRGGCEEVRLRARGPRGAGELSRSVSASKLERAFC